MAVCKNAYRARKSTSTVRKRQQRDWRRHSAWRRRLMPCSDGLHWLVGLGGTARSGEHALGQPYSHGLNMRTYRLDVHLVLPVTSVRMSFLPSQAQAESSVQSNKRCDDNDVMFHQWFCAVLKQWRNERLGPESSPKKGNFIGALFRKLSSEVDPFLLCSIFFGPSLKNRAQCARGMLGRIGIAKVKVSQKQTVFKTARNAN